MTKILISGMTRRKIAVTSGLLLAGFIWGGGWFAPTHSPAAELDPAVAQLEAARIAAVNKAQPSVVAVFAKGGEGGGSGVVITPDGYALTNFHVAKPCGNFMKCGLPDGKLYDAVIVGIDPVGDVALIKLHGREDFPVAEMADSDQVQVGDWCFAMGNPFLFATDFTPTISYGVISGTHRYQYPAGTLLEYADCLQTDAAINPGNSGGPLFDAAGRLIGINGRGSFEKRGRVNVGVGYAISINQIKKFLGALRSGRILDHATMGAQLSTSDTGKVVVTNILEESDAFRRGLRPDDEVLSFAGKPVKTVNGFKNILGTIPRDWRVPLTFRRENEEFSILVRLRGVHREDELAAIMAGEGEEKPPGKRPDGPPPEKKPAIPGLPLEKLFGKEKEDGPPAELKKQFEARTGYANYFFNKLEQDRLWRQLNQLGDFKDLSGTWKLSGEVGPRAPFEFELGPQSAKATLPVGDTEIDVTGGLAEALNPPGSGGLLAALHLWKKYVVGGPAKFGKLVYLGQLPLANRPDLCDVLVGTTDEVDIRFYFDPQSHLLTALELFTDEANDPCEVYFDGYQEIEGRQWPRQLTVQYGDRTFGVFPLTKVVAESALKKPDEKAAAAPATAGAAAENAATMKDPPAADSAEPATTEEKTTPADSTPEKPAADPFGDSAPSEKTPPTEPGK